MRMILVKDVFSIVVVIQKGQRKGRLGVRKLVHVVSVDVVLLQKVNHKVAHPVVSCLRNKGCGHARTSQRHNSIKRRATRNGAHGLSFFEDDVENCLAHTDNFTHVLKYNPYYCSTPMTFWVLTFVQIS